MAASVSAKKTPLSRASFTSTTSASENEHIEHIVRQAEIEEEHIVNELLRAHIQPSSSASSKMMPPPAMPVLDANGHIYHHGSHDLDSLIHCDSNLCSSRRSIYDDEDDIEEDEEHHIIHHHPSSHDSMYGDEENEIDLRGTPSNIPKKGGWVSLNSLKNKSNDAPVNLEKVSC
jgi:hypothetical protein